MTLHSINAWQLAAGLTFAILLGTFAAWRLFRKKPSPEELERERRQLLVQSGRLVDGMTLDLCEIESKDGRTLTMLLYNYRIGGVDYECSQDLTDIRNVAEVLKVTPGFPCTVRYQPGNPQNSIVIAETWTGIRAGLPVLPPFEDPDPLDLSHLRPGRG